MTAILSEKRTVKIDSAETFRLLQARSDPNTSQAKRLVFGYNSGLIYKICSDFRDSIVVGPGMRNR